MRIKAMSLRAAFSSMLRTAQPVASAHARGAAQAWLWWWSDPPTAADMHLR